MASGEHHAPVLSLLRPRHRWLIAAFCTAFFLVIANAIFAFRSIQTISTNQGWVTHTNEVINEIEELKLSAAEVQRGLWGFIITGRNDLLDYSSSNDDRLHAQIARIQGLTTDNPSQQKRVAMILPRIQSFIVFESSVRAQAEISRPSASATVSIGEGLGDLEAVNQLADEMRQEENRLLIERAEKTAASIQSAYITFSIGSVLSMGAIAWLLFMTLRNLKRRQQDSDQIYRLMMEVRRRADQLESTVAERTRELRDINSALESFSYSVSHDLKEPLRAMAGLAHAVAEDYGTLLPGEGQSYLNGIIDAAKRMHQLIENLLAYASLTRHDLPLTAVSLEHVVSDVLQQFRKRIQDMNAEIKLIKPLSTVIANPTALTQAISNLLSNSLKFTKPGSRPEIRIWSEEAGAKIKLWVEDNGIGISLENQGKIFEPFYRLNTSTHHSGAGVGLAIVRKAVERMGGAVAIASQDGEGARFVLELQKA
ncbi:MAG TPA: ATP-binding protein [Candidatus Angelobacter sp.]|nr:ATP-binding protein [Candidatus Angelobacter sp.]